MEPMDKRLLIKRAVFTQTRPWVFRRNVGAQICILFGINDCLAADFSNPDSPHAIEKIVSDPAMVERIQTDVVTTVKNIIANASDATKEVGKCQLMVAFVFSGFGRPAPDYR